MSSFGENNRGISGFFAGFCGCLVTTGAGAGTVSGITSSSGGLSYMGEYARCAGFCTGDSGDAAIGESAETFPGERSKIWSMVWMSRSTGGSAGFTGARYSGIAGGELTGGMIDEPQRLQKPEPSGTWLPQ